jgi:hypothetical protein
MSQDIDKLSGISTQPAPDEPRSKEQVRALDREAMVANTERADKRASIGEQVTRQIGSGSNATQNMRDASRASQREGGSGSIETQPPKSAANQELANTRAAELARESASAQSIATEKLKAKAMMQAQLRFLNKDAKVAFQDKSGLIYQFDRQALEQLLEQLDSDANTVDIGGHDIPLGVFDDGVSSFAELDQTRVENGLVPLFSAATS